MPFGLKNGVQAFQNLMDTVGRGLDFLFIYLDGILIARRSRQKHGAHIRLTINLDKCQFGLSSIDFRVHHVIQHGAVPLPDKVEAIRQLHRALAARVCGYGDFLSSVHACGGPDHAAVVSVTGHQAAGCSVERQGRGHV